MFKKSFPILSIDYIEEEKNLLDIQYFLLLANELKKLII